ncbi:GIY-YIG nuclease family protein [Leucobacter sp. HY1908]
MTAYVYILASKRNGTLYVGVTSDLMRRLNEHRSGQVPGFTEKYGVTRLVWYNEGPSVLDAIVVEKKIKNRGRQWKVNLIERENPDWNDLAADWE